MAAVSDRENQQHPKLRVIDEEASEEEVLRLEKDSGRADPVVRLSADPPAESPRVLQPEERGETLRTHQPDLDKLLEESGEMASPEESWEETGPKSAVPYGWFVLILLALGSALFFGLRWSSERPRANEAVESAIQRVERDEKETFEAEKILEGVGQTVRAYVNAGSIDELLEQVRDRERVEPLIHEYYRVRPLPEREFERLTMFQPMNLEGRPFYVVEFEAQTGSDMESDSLLIAELADGTFGVDWETDVRHQPMPWAEYVRERPEGTPMVFRVWAEPDLGGLFTHEFRDESKWQGHVLTVPDSPEFLIGYARRDSEAARRLHRLLTENRLQATAVCLKLLRPEGTRSPRGVIIEEVVSERWLIQDPPE